MNPFIRDNGCANKVQDIDAMLYAAAEERTRGLGLSHLLPQIRQSAAPRARPQRRYARLLVPAAAALLLLIAPLIARPIVVDGKTYLALNGNVKIEGIVHNVDAPKDKSALVRLYSNQYVLVDGLADETEIMVLPPDSAPQPVKKQKTDTPSEHAVSMQPTRVYPVINSLVVREGPGMEYAELGVLVSGQLIKKMGMSGKWAVVEWMGGVAYVFDEYLFEAPEPLPAYEPVSLYATEPVNVRALPVSSDESQVLYELQTGERVLCTGVIGEWSQIEFGGQKAYVFSKYLRP